MHAYALKLPQGREGSHNLYNGKSVISIDLEKYGYTRSFERCIPSDMVEKQNITKYNHLKGPFMIG